MSFFGNRKQQEQPAPLPAPQQKPESVPSPVVPQQPVGFDTVLGASCSIEGTLRSSGNVRLDGTFSGTLEITGNVLVGETAKINADVNAKNISIAGAVRGNVSGKKVQLLRTGRIWGDIHATALTTEEGAFIDGKITMMGHEANTPAEEPKAPEAKPEEHPKGTGEENPSAKLIEKLTPVGMGAMEDDTDAMFHDNEGDSQEEAKVENISADEAETLPVGGDAKEGQRNLDLGEEDPSDEDEVRQST